MTIKELKEIIKDLPDDMLIGDSGHFGEYLECWDVTVSTVTKSRFDKERIDILQISNEEKGEEPD